MHQKWWKFGENKAHLPTFVSLTNKVKKIVSCLRQEKDPFFWGRDQFAVYFGKFNRRLVTNGDGQMSPFTIPSLLHFLRRDLQFANICSSNMILVGDFFLVTFYNSSKNKYSIKVGVLLDSITSFKSLPCSWLHKALVAKGLRNCGMPKLTVWNKLYSEAHASSRNKFSIGKWRSQVRFSKFDVVQFCRNFSVK